MTAYLVKYSKNPITSANFNSADTYSQDWIPASAGMTETKTITLTPGDTYYVAVKAYDDNPYGANYSDWDESYYTDNKNRATAKNFENLLKIPNASFENGSLGWSFNSSYIYVSQSYAYDGVYSCKVNDPTSSTDGREISSVYADVTAGLVYGAGAYFLVEQNSGNIGSTLIDIEIRWYDSAGAMISSTTSTNNTLSAFGTWELLYVQGTAPANAVKAKMYVRVWETANNNNDVYIDNVIAKADTIPPAAITDLTAQTGSNPGEITLTWTAPGDDGTTGDNLTGSKYEIYAATYPREGNPNWLWFARKTEYSSVSSVGTQETYTLIFQPGTTHYFAIRTYDVAGNLSELDVKSSSATTQAKAYAAPGEATKHIVINEVNTDDDWIELYNPTNSTQNLKGWTIWSFYSGSTYIDTGKEIITFGDFNFPPGAYLVVDFNEDTLTPTPFLTSSGYYLAYSNADGINAASEDGIVLYDDTFPSVSGIVDAMVYSDYDYYYLYPNAKSTQRDVLGLDPVADYQDLIDNGQWVGSYSGDRSDMEATMVFARYLRRFTYYNPYVGKYKDSEENDRSLARDENSTDIVSNKYEWNISVSPSMGKQNEVPDKTRPSQITDLTVTPGENVGTIRLKWTAPGDDGTTGQAAGYVVRYGETPIDMDNFENMSVVSNWKLSVIWHPKAAGQQEDYLIGGLESNTTYYFCIVAEDENGNKSLPSNSPGASAGDVVGSFVRINEVAPQEADGNDWIEIYNAHTSTVNLSGWKIYQKALDLVSGYKYEEEELYTFGNVSLGPGDYLVLVFMETGVDGTVQYNSDGSKAYYYYVSNQNKYESQLDEIKNVIMLRDNSDILIDCVFYNNRASYFDSANWYSLITAAEFYNQWSPSQVNEDTMVDWSSGKAGLSMARDENSTDTDATATAKDDWEVTGQTKGYKNDWTPPSAITDLSASAGSNEDEVQLQWTAPGDDGTTGNNTGGWYVVKFATFSYTGETWWNSITEVEGYQGSRTFTKPKDAGQTETRTITGLYPGKTFYFCVKTFDSTGNDSGLADYAFCTLPDLTPPQPVAATPAWIRTSSTTATIYWEAGPRDVAYYEITRTPNYAPVYSTRTTNTYWTDSWLTEGTTYTFTITAYDLGGKASPPLTINVYNAYNLPSLTKPLPLPDEINFIGNDFVFPIEVQGNIPIDVPVKVYYTQAPSEGWSVFVSTPSAGQFSTYSTYSYISADFIRQIEANGGFYYYVEYGDIGRSTKTATVFVSVSREKTYSWSQGAVCYLNDGNVLDGTTTITLGNTSANPAQLKVSQLAYSSAGKGTEAERVDISVNSGYPVAAYEFEPLGSNGASLDVRFQEPVEFTLLYLEKGGNILREDGTLVSGASESRLRAYFYDERNEVWRYIGGEVDTSQNIISFKFPHLSKFAIFAIKPNAIKPVQRFLTFRTPVDFGDATEVKIYDVRGRKILTLTGSAPLTWYGCDKAGVMPNSPDDLVESGAYIYEAKGGGKKATGVIVVVK